jgi:hypothetical protein
MSIQQYQPFLRLPTPRRHLESEPRRRVAGTQKISPEYTASVRVLRAAVLANREIGLGRIARERADDVSMKVIDIVPALDQASRRTLLLVAGMLERACSGPRHRRNGNGHG